MPRIRMLEITRSIALICIAIILLVAAAFYGFGILHEAGHLKTTTDFRNLSNGLQSIVITLGLIIGGVWSWLKARVYLEDVLAKSKAQAELRELQERPNIEVIISCEQLSFGNEPNFYITGEVILENTGNHPAHIVYEEPIYITELDLGADGSCRIVKHYRDEIFSSPTNEEFRMYGEGALACLSSAVIDPNSKTRNRFIRRVENSGLYLVEFRVSVDSKRLSAVQKDLLSAENYRTYSDQTYVVLKDVVALEES